MTTNNVVSKEAVVEAMRAQETAAREDREVVENLIGAVDGDRLRYSESQDYRQNSARYMGDREKAVLLRALRADLDRAHETLVRVTAAREQVESGELVVVVKGRVEGVAK